MEGRGMMSWLLGEDGIGTSRIDGRLVDTLDDDGGDKDGNGERDEKTLEVALELMPVSRGAVS